MPTIATMFNSRLLPHSMAGYTTKTVHGSFVSLDFPTNGQAKELPTATWDRLWRDVPRTNVTVRSLPTQGRVTPNWVTTDTNMSSPDRNRSISEDPRFPTTTK